MAAFVVPANVQATIDRIYGDNADEKARVMKALESGKTVLVGKHKLKGIKADKAKAKTPSPAAPPPGGSTPPAGSKDNKDK